LTLLNALNRNDATPKNRQRRGADWIVAGLLLFALPGLASSFASAAPQDLASGTRNKTAYNNRASYQEVIQKLASAIEYEVSAKQLPAFSIALVEGDEVVWANGYGFQDADKKIPATPETVYRVGSISKLLTDISVMKLVESGELDLDASITDYLPDFQPDNTTGKPITLRMLMTHRSGLVRESPVGNYFDPNEPTLAQTVASLNGTPLIYEPDSRTKYSNAAIAVVGSVLESKLNGRHSELVKREIFEPLQMSSSSFDLTPAIDERLSTASMWTYDDRRFEAPKFLLGTGPAGNLYSTVLDLCKFTSFIFNEGRTQAGQVIKPETLKMMMTAQVDADGKPQGFGIGFRVGELDGNRKIGHGGAVYGFSTQLEALPDRKLGVAAASALDGSNGLVSRLSDYALRLMIAKQDGKPMPEYQRTDIIPPERARALVGLYQENAGDRFARISELNGRCFVQLGSFRHELRTDLIDGNLVTDDVIGHGTKIAVKDIDSLVVGDKTFIRVKNVPPPKALERWRGLIGEYGWDHNTLYILEDAGQLYALIEWFYYYPLTEVNANEFKFPDYGLYHGEGLKFTRSENGDATEVVAAEVKFVRREVGSKDGETFKIAPVKPIDELRVAALTATPPEEVGEFRQSDLVELTSLDPTLKLDIRYASTNNFTGSVFYQQAKAFMQRPAAEAVVRANARLKPQGLGLLIHDAYRPWHVTKMFWDATPAEMKDFVANPANGSRHNRGCAVDITLYDLKTGDPIQMVAGYDEFSPRSFPMYPGGTSLQRWYRQLLRQTMEAEGFAVYEFEWWHFDFKDWKQYRIGNLTFEEISPK
jgi:CubicO group peptidase (beta-lactamase class C family)/D-alanyl-D-alanine dipeptidase